MYLDYAAAGLYTNTQIDAHAEDLKEQLYGNPHSLSTLASCSSTAVLVNKKQWQIVDAQCQFETYGSPTVTVSQRISMV